MKFLQRHKLALAGGFTGLLQMVLLPYAVQGTCRVGSIVGLFTWTLPIVGVGIGVAGEGNSQKWRRAASSLIAFSFGAVFMVLLSAVLLGRDALACYPYVLGLCSVLVFWAAFFNAGTGRLSFVASATFAVVTGRPKLIDHLVALRLGSLGRVLQETGRLEWASMSLAFVLMLVFCYGSLLLGEVVLALKGPEIGAKKGGEGG